MQNLFFKSQNLLLTLISYSYVATDSHVHVNISIAIQFNYAIQFLLVPLSSTHLTPASLLCLQLKGLVMLVPR